MLSYNITDDRVFGVMSCHKIEAFFDEKKLAVLRRRVNEAKGGAAVVYGPGAALVTEGDVLVYADLARWEIQQRYRSGEIGNWCAHNEKEETLRKYKRGFFIDWRVSDRHKMDLWNRIDFVLDTNKKESPVLAAGETVRKTLENTARRPFRTVPYFDPGVWGGQWMKTHCGLDPAKENYAWSFDGVPESDTAVYLGVKTGVNPDEMISALAEAQQTGEFDAEKFVNRIPAKKHDHFLIPAGTVHCSGKDVMVLEISATPYIFTFKLWDWNRVGLDGRPRPIHLEHGRKNIQFDRDTEFVKKQLVNAVEEMASGDGWREERTGLHEREFIETRRHWFTKAVPHDTNGGVNVLNLVEGSAAVVESPTGEFEPFTVHYAETFIIPAAVGKYTIRPAAAGEKCATVKAYVRG